MSVYVYMFIVWSKIADFYIRSDKWRSICESDAIIKQRSCPIRVAVHRRMITLRGYFLPSRGNSRLARYRHTWWRC